MFTTSLLALLFARLWRPVQCPRRSYAHVAVCVRICLTHTAVDVSPNRRQWDVLPVRHYSLHLRSRAQQATPSSGVGRHAGHAGLGAPLSHEARNGHYSNANFSRKLKKKSQINPSSAYRISPGRPGNDEP